MIVLGTDEVELVYLLLRHIDYQLLPPARRPVVSRLLERATDHIVDQASAEGLVDRTEAHRAHPHPS